MSHQFLYHDLSFGKVSVSQITAKMKILDSWSTQNVVGLI